MEGRATNPIEHGLGSALAAWGELPEVAKEIPGWDEYERLDFAYEWPLEEMRLGRIGRYARAGGLDACQADRHLELERLVERNRPVVEGLLDRVIGPGRRRGVRA